jgi:hypothetical protein
VDLLLTRLILDLELAVVDVFLAVVAVAVVCLLFLLEGNFRVQLGSKFLGGGIWWRTMSKDRDGEWNDRTHLGGGIETWKNEQQFWRRQRRECAAADERRSRSDGQHHGALDERVGAETA